ncbi:MAG: hypothetical protein ABIP71_08130, partial [Verrucomicrobiota bacterium]
SPIPRRVQMFSLRVPHSFSRRARGVAPCRRVGWCNAATGLSDTAAIRKILRSSAVKRFHRHMRKMRDDSTWNRLTPEQRETLESWLFDENLGYAKTLERVQKEFGVEATMASVGRFYRRRARERQVEELVEAQATAAELNDLPVSATSLREAAIKLVGKAVLKMASEKPDELAHLVSFTKLLVESDDNDIRRARLKLAQQYFDYEATAASLKELPQLRSYLTVIGDDTNLSHDEKMKRVHAILFGWDRPGGSGKEQDKSRNGD